MPTVFTTRLRLVPLTREDLRALVSTQDGLLRIAGAVIDRGTLVEPPVEGAIHVKCKKMAGAPRNEHPWFSYWLIVLRSEDRGIGLLGFKGTPTTSGEVEIGYGIAPGYRRRGYATEAAHRLIEWAFSDPRCRTVTAKGVRHDNVGSQRVAANLGMRCVRRDANASDWQLNADRSG